MIFIYLWAGTFFIASFSIDDPESTLFPRIITVLSIILATAFLISNVAGRQKDTEYDFSGTKRAMIMAVLVLLYMAGNYFAGFYLSTLIYMPIGMFYLGQRNIKLIAIVSISLPAFVYVFFDVLLQMSIPTGVLFF